MKFIFRERSSHKIHLFPFVPHFNFRMESLPWEFEKSNRPASVIVREEIDGTSLLKLLNCKEELQVTPLPKELLKITEYKEQQLLHQEGPPPAKKAKAVKPKKDIPKSMYDFLMVLSKQEWEKDGSKWVRSVTYARSDKYKDFDDPNIGRLYSGAFSMQTLKREFRDTLFGNNTTLDFTSCHFRILLGFFQVHASSYSLSFHVDCIREYCTNREGLHTQISNLTGLKVGDPAIKELFNGALMGMSMNSWKKANHVQLDAARFPFYPKLCQELTAYRSFVASTFPMVPYFEKDDDGGYGHCIKNFSLFLHTIESVLLVKTRQLVERAGLTVSCLVHDGLEVVGDVSDALVESINDTLNRDSGYQSLLLVKKEKKPFDVSGVDPAEDNSYLGKKKKFERNNSNFKVLEQNCYYSFDGENFQPYSHKQFKEKWLHLQYFDEKKQTMETFIERWMRDETLLCYRRAELYPNRNECPSDCFNTFMGFDIEHVELTEQERRDPVNLEHLEALKDLSRRIVENDEHRDYVERYVAHLFKHPATKPRVANIFQSNAQGIGKGSYGNALIKMIGKSHGFMTSKPEIIFGTFNNAIYNKILVILDEKPFPKQDHDTLKSMITEKSATIRSMFTNPFSARCYLRLFNFLNQDKAVSCLEVNERRFNITGSSASKMTEEEGKFFSKVVENEKALRLYYEYLLTVPVEADYAFDEHRPTSILYSQLQEFHRSIEIEYLTEFLVNHVYQVTDGSRYAQGSSAEIREFFRRLTVRGSTFFSGFVEFVNANKFTYTSNAKTFRLRIETFFADLTAFGIKYGRSQTGGMDTQSWSFGNTMKMFQYLAEKKYLKPEQLTELEELEREHGCTRERVVSTV